MKKLCYASLLLGLVLLLAGCGAAPAEPGPQESDVEAAKYHSYEILEGADGSVLYTVETPEAVAALDELIKDAGEARVERPWMKRETCFIPMFICNLPRSGQGRARRRLPGRWRKFCA